MFDLQKLEELIFLLKDVTLALEISSRGRELKAERYEVMRDEIHQKFTEVISTK